MAGNSTCPYVVKKLLDEDDELIKRHYAKYQNDYVYFGKTGYLLPLRYHQRALDIRDMPLRATDTFVVAFPRSGTTWTQELVWLVANDLNFDTAKSVPFFERVPFVEHDAFINPSLKAAFMESNTSPELEKILDNLETPATEVLASSPDPRIIKSHLPLSLLPPQILDVAKVVYVARDPRDVMVSCYHFYTSNRLVGLEAKFKEFFELFLKDLVPWGPHIDHVKEAWAKRHHPNMLFLFYEELSKDLPATARRVTHFLGKHYTEEQIAELCDFLSFDNFQQSQAINPESFKHFLKQNNFIRQGKPGGWRDYFDENMSQRAESWIQDHLQDTDLSFPPNITLSPQKK